MAKKAAAVAKKEPTIWRHITVEQTDIFQGGERLYRVVGLTNTIDPLIGSMMKASEVSEWCNRFTDSVIIQKVGK